MNPTEKQKMQSEVDKRILKNEKRLRKAAHLKCIHTDKEGLRGQHHGRSSDIFLR